MRPLGLWRGCASGIIFLLFCPLWAGCQSSIGLILIFEWVRSLLPSEILLVHKPEVFEIFWPLDLNCSEDKVHAKLLRWRLQKDGTAPTLNIFKRHLKAHFLCLVFETVVCWGVGRCLYCPLLFYLGFCYCFLFVESFLWLYSTLVNTVCFNGAL